MSDEAEVLSCSVCGAAIDLEIEDLDEGDIISCDECGAVVKVESLHPVELVVDEEHSNENSYEDDEDEEEY
jgi:alpha-aminoadipate carrier protein LysW